MSSMVGKYVVNTIAISRRPRIMLICSHTFLSRRRDRERQTGADRGRQRRETEKDRERKREKERDIETQRDTAT